MSLIWTQWTYAYEFSYWTKIVLPICIQSTAHVQATNGWDLFDFLNNCFVAALWSLTKANLMPTIWIWFYFAIFVLPGPFLPPRSSKVSIIALFSSILCRFCVHNCTTRSKPFCYPRMAFRRLRSSTLFLLFFPHSLIYFFLPLIFVNPLLQKSTWLPFWLTGSCLCNLSASLVPQRSATGSTTTGSTWSSAFQHGSLGQILSYSKAGKHWLKEL